MVERMNPEWKQKWLTALRSGEYKQDPNGGRLRNKQHDGSYSFCCLGVLCDLLGNEDHGEWGPGDSFRPGDGTASSSYLPGGVLNRVNLQFKGQLPHPIPCTDAERRAHSNVHNHIHSLSQMNDDGYSFIEIANVIEEQL